MVALLFTSIFIFGLAALALYLWVPRAKDSEPALLPPAERLRGLFGDAEEPVSHSDGPDLESERNSLRTRAESGDKNSLDAAHALNDRVFYTDLLRQLTSQAQSKEAVFALASYVTRSDLPVTRELANAFVTHWYAAPDRTSTPSALHLAALADDAEFYRKTVDAAFSFWRNGLLANISAAELRALFDGEFWVLSAPIRNSAAGFVLKRTLASVRRDLEDAMHDKL
jgi:hypothetical protein